MPKSWLVFFVAFALSPPVRRKCPGLRSPWVGVPTDLFDGSACPPRLLAQGVVPRFAVSNSISGVREVDRCRAVSDGVSKPFVLKAEDS